MRKKIEEEKLCEIRFRWFAHTNHVVSHRECCP